MNNRENFLWWGQADSYRKLLVPYYATKTEIKQDDQGYWLNVWWKSGVIAPLTIQESIQALEGN